VCKKCTVCYSWFHGVSSSSRFCTIPGTYLGSYSQINYFLSIQMGDHCHNTRTVSTTSHQYAIHTLQSAVRSGITSLMMMMVVLLSPLAFWLAFLFHLHAGIKAFPIEVESITVSLEHLHHLLNCFYSIAQERIAISSWLIV
jgi:hypothetical protein